MLSVLRADSFRRRTRDGSDALQGAGSPIERWDGEGGQIWQEALDDEQTEGRPADGRQADDRKVAGRQGRGLRRA